LKNEEVIDLKYYDKYLNVGEKNFRKIHLNLEKVIEDPKNLIMIEWPEHVGFKTDLQINFKALDKAGDYEIEFVGRG
jgi:tRNA A37 threonylcarbamoyladenosine biosynthesis protein TsaE